MQAPLTLHVDELLYQVVGSLPEMVQINFALLFLLCIVHVEVVSFDGHKFTSFLFPLWTTCVYDQVDPNIVE